MDEDTRHGGGARPALPARVPIIGGPLAPVHRPPPPTPGQNTGQHLGRIIPRQDINARPPPPRSSNIRPTRTIGNEIIGLQGRRNGVRQQNEYVESPQKSLVLGGKKFGRSSPHYRDGELVTISAPQDRNCPPVGGLTTTGIITSQPQSTGLKVKDPQHHHPHNLHHHHTSSQHHLCPNQNNNSPQILQEQNHQPTIKGHNNSVAPDSLIGSPRTGDPHESIICHKCNKCRCAACTGPRDLPSKWLCNEHCNCSADNVVRFCSCLCCVQFIFYHASKTDSDNAISDRPCACLEVKHCGKRWVCMGLMSLCLPCLCLYWPLKGLVGLSKLCYNGCSRRGCQCHRDNSGQTTMGTKRPLIDSESSQSSSA